MSKDEFEKYSINEKILFQPLEKIDIPNLISESTKPWQNHALCEVNDCVVRLGVIEGEFHWHKHDEEDEYFYVIEGKLFIDLEDKTIELLQGQGCVIPKQVLHKTRASERTSIMMVEGKTVKPTGD
ncbi:MAG: cupin domain-containing protein [Candidatus Heimdallarchaeota archaeon]|nr:cupin domain-containing protein [Candidatus Heimdallarchaeota archaeon]